MLTSHGATANVLKVAVVGLANYDIDRANFFITRSRERVFDCAGDSLGYIEGIGQDHRRFYVTQLPYLGAPSQLAKAISYEYSRRNFLAKEVSRMRNDGGHSGPDRISLAERGVTHRHARNIGDCVQRAWAEHARDDSQLAGPLQRRKL